LKKSIQLGIASIALAAAIAGCGNKGAKAVATINGEPISYEDFYYSLSMKPTVRVMTNQGPIEARVAERLDFQALQESILRRITLQLAADEQVKPTDDQVREEIKFRGNLNPGYQAQMKANGYDYTHLKQLVELELARERLLTRGITVTKEEAEKYVKDNPTRFMEPKTIDLRWILLPRQETKAKENEKKEQIKKDLLSGRGFAEIAATESAYRENGNMFPIRVASQLPKEVSGAVSNLNIGQHTDWILTSNGYAMFEVAAKADAKAITMNAVKIEGVRRSLALTQGQKTNDLADRIIKKLKASKEGIKVQDKGLQDLWKKSFDDFMKSQKEAGAAGANPAQPGATGK